MSGDGTYEQGMAFFRAARYDESVACFSRAADAGDARAQLMLGAMYHEGMGVECDLARAAAYLRRAAEQGVADAQFSLGICYAYGDGVERDAAKAAEWYALAARADSANAQHNLGALYYKGDGVERDLTRAVELFTRAVGNGNKFAYNELGICYYNGEGVDRDIDRAAEYFRIAAEAGMAAAQNNIAFCYEKGTGVTADIKTAAEWYERSANGGCSRAQSALGMMYMLGEGVEQNSARAVELLTAAAENGEVDAMLNLGISYCKGENVEQDFVKGVRYIARAAETGSVAAVYNLGVCYEQGHGVPRDLDLAERQYEQAAELGYEYAKDALEELRATLAAERERDLGIVGSGERYDLFVSWNHADLAFKNALVDGIENFDYGGGENASVRTRYRAWESDRDASGLLDECIQNAVDKSKFFLVILSENSVESKWVRQEVGMALGKVACGKWSYDNIIAVYAEPDKCVPALDRITDESDPMYKLKSITGKFAASATDKRLISDICAQIKNGLEADAVRRYAKMQTDADATRFKFALTKQIDTALGGIGTPAAAFLKTLMSIENGYIERKLVRADGGEISGAQALAGGNSFYITGAGGTGKSIFITKLIYDNFGVNGEFFVRLDIRDHESAVEGGASLETLINAEINKYLAATEYHSPAAIDRARADAKRVTVVIDGVDEISASAVTRLLHAIDAHRKAYGNDRFIFTSRQPIALGELRRIFGDKFELFGLSAFGSDARVALYRAIAEASGAQAGIDAPSRARLEREFFKRLDAVAADISGNPMLLSNLIFIYLKNGGADFPSCKYDILNMSADMVLKDLESERGVLDTFAYRTYISGDKLDRLLEYVAFKKCSGDMRSVEALTIAYFKLKGLCDEDECETAGSAVYEYLRRRAVVTADKISHDIFTVHFASRYVYGKIFTRSETDDDRECVAFNGEAGKKYLQERLRGGSVGTFATDGVWAEIAVELIMRLDREAYLCGGGDMAENNASYATLCETLSLAIGERGFGDGAIEEIKKLAARPDGLRYGEFVERF